MIRLKKYAFLLLSILSIASCTGTFPSIGILAPQNLAGYQMDASGLKGSYYYRFSANGTYESETQFPSGEKESAKSGTWIWKRMSTSDAILTLDRNLVITLKFTTRHHANAMIPGSERLYPVEFTAP